MEIQQKMDIHPRLFRAILIIVLIFQDCNVVEANEAILIDTRTATTDLGWTVPLNSNWIEHTTQDADGNERRIFQVCEIKQPNQNNWVRTEFIPVQSASRINIEIEFTIRSCEDVKNVKTCKETFNLYFYETDRDEATSTFPPWREAPYVKIDTIAADKRFLPGSAETNFETRDIGPITKKGIYLAIQDTGACMALMHVRVYYKYCPPHVQNLAFFKRTIAGDQMTSLVPAEGVCVPNSVAQENRKTKLYCNGEGDWNVPSGTCVCFAGYEPNHDLSRCNPCPKQKYKNVIGNHPCQACPAYSRATNSGSTICECSNHYYRAENDESTKECTKPPSAPEKLRSIVNNTSVILKWDDPLDDGGRDDVSYRVVCSQCKSGYVSCNPCSSEVDFIPRHKDLKSNMVTMKRLNAYSYYRFEIYAANGVTTMALAAGEDSDKFVAVHVETSQAAPSPVVGVHSDATQTSSNAILLRWERPRMTNGKILEYEIKLQQFLSRMEGKDDFEYFDPDTVIPVRVNKTKNTFFKIENLEPGTSYVVTVRARTAAGYGKYSIPIKVETSELTLTTPTTNNNADGDRTLQLIVAVICGLFIVILIIAIILFCTRRRNKKKKKHLDIEKQPMFNTKEYPGHKTYVDPTTYEDPHRAVRDFTKEIDAAWIKIEEVIGGGEFGDVCRGRMRQPGKPEQDVAIKTLKTGYTTQQKLDFLGEASIMGQFDNPNVIRLEGVVTKTRPLMIVTEYMKNRSLDAFLRNHDGELTVPQLVGMLRHIASGMRYLSDMGYVHRDLAARNILVDDRLVCKVSDFGLSRVLEDDADASYITRGGKIPIRWTAPEAITFRKFTSASDVWSFGIVMWEVMSYGERPYWGMSNQDVIQAVGSGYRLPAPMDCPHIQHQLMLDSWKKDRNQRPKFSQIVARLEKMLKEPTLLSSTVEKEKTGKMAQMQRTKGDSSDVNTATTGTSTGSNTSTSRTATPNDDLSYQDDLGHHTSSSATSDPMSVHYRPGDDLQMPVSKSSPSVSLTSSIASPASLGVWLDELNLGQYKDTYTKNGCTSLEQVLQLTSSDLSRMGIVLIQHQDRLLESIRTMREVSSHNHNMNSQRHSKTYYQHRIKTYDNEGPPKYEDTVLNGRIPNGIPV